MQHFLIVQQMICFSQRPEMFATNARIFVKNDFEDYQLYFPDR
jgi:hypothetical protein